MCEATRRQGGGGWGVGGSHCPSSSDNDAQINRVPTNTDACRAVRCGSVSKPRYRPSAEDTCSALSRRQTASDHSSASVSLSEAPGLEKRLRLTRSTGKLADGQPPANPHPHLVCTEHKVVSYAFGTPVFVLNMYGFKLQQTKARGATLQIRSLAEAQRVSRV